MDTSSANPAASLEAEKPSGLVSALLVIYLFLLYSRIFEASMLFGMPNLYVILLLSAVALLAICLSGGLTRAAKTRTGILLIAFTLWAIAILPFSTWRSESLRQLDSVWLKSLASFFIIVGLTSTFSDCKRAFSAIGFGAAISILFVAVTERMDHDRLTAFGGSLGNSNELAFHVVFGLPFLLLLISDVNRFLKIPLGAIALLSLAVTFKTASRAGLIMAAAIIFLALLRVSWSNKIKIALVAALGVGIGLLTITQEAKERYKTIFVFDASSMSALSAEESTHSRTALRQQSIELTLQHPLFGVGMGVFAPAAADLAQSKGEHALWQATHNSYTQISCETGLIGFVLIVAVIVVNVRALLKLDRTARELKLIEIHNMALCVLLSFAALLIHFFFDALGYDYYLPMVVGLGTSLACTARPLIEQACREGKQSSEATPQETCIPSAVLAGASTGTKESPVPVTTARPSAARPPALTSNPYRFGHERVNRRTGGTPNRAGRAT